MIPTVAMHGAAWTVAHIASFKRKSDFVKAYIDAPYFFAEFPDREKRAGMLEKAYDMAVPKSKEIEEK